MSVIGISERIARGWSAAPDAVGLWFEDRSWSWRDIAAGARALQNALDRCGVGAGRRVAIVLRNQPALAVAVLGVLESGRVLVTVNGLQPQRALAGELRMLAADAVVGLGTDFEDSLVVAQLARGRAAWLELADDVGGPVFTRRIGYGADSASSGDRPAVEMLTSGTTGPPKRIPVHERAFEDAIVAGMRGAADRDGAPQPKSAPSLIAGPLVHVSGLFSLLVAAAEVRPVVLLERFAVDPWVDAVFRHRLKFASLPPAAMRMVLDAQVPVGRLASLVAVRSGTAPLPPDVQRAFEDRYGVPVLVQYGATEWMGGLAGWSIEDHRRWARDKQGSVGRALPGVELRVVHPDTGAALEPAAVGILEVRAPARSGSSDEWVRTTDLASIDEEGFLFIHGRSDDVIVRGGFKISPSVVVAVLRTHSAVRDATVLGVPDERLGQVPVAVIEARAGMPPPSVRELEAACRAALPGYQVPVRFVVVDELPRTPSLKVSRTAVLDLLSGSTSA